MTHGRIRPTWLRLSLGLALLIAAGCGDSKPEDTAALDAAALQARIEASRTAIADLDREDDPEDWAEQHEELGRLLSALGEREPGIPSLEAGADALRAALSTRSREDDPLAWAQTQRMLGTTLTSLGAREPKSPRLAEGVELLREAAAEPALEDDPDAWARTRSALGHALILLADRERSIALYDEATRAYEPALDVLAEKQDKGEWARTLIDLGLAHLRVGEAARRTSEISRAVELVEKSLEVRAAARAAQPLEWLEAQILLGEALHSWGMLASDYDRLRDAAGAYRAALQESALGAGSAQAVATRINLGLALTTLGLSDAGTALLDEAKRELEQAIRDASTLGVTEPPANARQALAAIEIELRRRATLVTSEAP